MSAIPVLPDPRPTPAPRRPALRAVPAPRRRPRVAYGLLAVAGAVTIGAAQMLFSVLSTQSSFELSALTQQQKEVTWQKQILDDRIAGLSSPQYLAANAAALGMVINESPSYLRLSDGAVLGPQQPSASSSSVDALARGSVGNALITDTPLVTEPQATIDGPPPAPDPVTAPATPPPLSAGLPTPTTH